MKAPRRPKPVRSLVSADFIEQLESRQLLAATLADGVLTVAGSGRGDNISIKRSGANIVVKLGSNSRNFAAANVDSLVISGKGGDDRIAVSSAIPNVVINGGTGDDNIKGSGAGDFIVGGAGDDVLNGRGGNDNIYGDDGDDTVQGGAGNDTLGGDDEDKLWARTGSRPGDQVGNDVLNGGAGNDWLLSGMESDIVDDPSGNDQLTGGSGNDVIDKRGRQLTGEEFEIGNGDTITDEEANDFVPVDDVATDFPSNGTDTSYSQHRHAFLKIFVVDDNGTSREMFIPWNAGEFLGAPVVHGHEEPPNGEDARGYEVHFHNTPDTGGPSRVFTLGDFFEHLGLSFSSQNLGRLRVDADHELVMTVKPKGGGVTTPAAGQNFNNYVIQTESNDFDSTHFDQIVITYRPKS